MGKRKIGLAGDIRHPIQTTTNGLMVYSTSQKTISYFDPIVNKETAQTPFVQSLDASVLAFSPNGQWALATGSGNEAGCVLNTSTGLIAIGGRGNQSVAQAGAFSPDGIKVAISGGPGSNLIQLFDIVTKSKVANPAIPAKKVTSALA